MYYLIKDKKINMLFIVMVSISIIMGAAFAVIISNGLFVAHPREHGVKTFLLIWLYNSENYLKYILLFFITPLLVIIDWLIMSFQIMMGVRELGKESVKMLLPHSLFEIPNIIFYQSLNFKLFCELIKHKKVSIVKEHFKKTKKIYIVSYVILVLSAFIEGMIG